MRINILNIMEILGCNETWANEVEKVLDTYGLDYSEISLEEFMTEVKAAEHQRLAEKGLDKVVGA